MPSLNIPRFPAIGETVFVTYLGTPNACTYWEVVEFLDPGEGAPTGSLVFGILVADANGYAVNQYTASSTPGDVGKTERIKVSESA